MFSLQLLFYPNLGCYYRGAHEKSCMLKVYFIPLFFFFFFFSSTFTFPFPPTKHIGRDSFLSSLKICRHFAKEASLQNLFLFLRNNYSMLLIPQFKLFPPQTPKHFMHEKVSIQLQSLWRILVNLVAKMVITLRNDLIAEVQ